MPGREVHRSGHQRVSSHPFERYHPRNLGVDTSGNEVCRGVPRARDNRERAYLPSAAGVVVKAELADQALEGRVLQIIPRGAVPVERTPRMLIPVVPEHPSAKCSAAVM